MFCCHCDKEIRSEHFTKSGLLYLRFVHVDTGKPECIGLTADPGD